MRKNFITLTIVAAALTGALLVFGTPTSSSSASTPCDESMKECCKKESKGSNDNSIWETVSGQFSTGLN
ncbi:MAG TPA: hypothetical protein VF487_19115 [Chitinophagaceae bacterium]